MELVRRVCVFISILRWSNGEIVKSISYNPVPCRTPCAFEQDDFSVSAFKALWGPSGRADLKVIRSLGANRIRLHGNNPEDTHGAFLDEAEALELGVSLGLSDKPFISNSDSCLTTGFNCYHQAKAAYLRNLRSGLLRNGSYHSALKEVVVINEPDLKLPGVHDPEKLARGIISALDGLLEAEKEAGVTGPFVNFTVPFSFTVCPRCHAFQAVASLGQMTELRAALLSPASYGYVPVNNLTALYYGRLTNSFHAASKPFQEIEAVLSAYATAFSATPVVIQEYHPMGSDAAAEMAALLELAEGGSSLFRGVCFFEFQSWATRELGLFSLGERSIANFEYHGRNSSAWCLVANASRLGVLAKAFGGEAMNSQELCVPDPQKVLLGPKGLQEMAALSPSHIEVFVERFIHTLGGEVQDSDEHRRFAGGLAAAATEPGSSPFELLEAELVAGPAWVSYDAAATCIADRNSNDHAVGVAMGQACGSMQTFDCDEIPPECRGNVWDAADYAFSVFYSERRVPSLENCYFGGRAFLAGEAHRNASGVRAACVVPLGFSGRRLREASDTWELELQALSLTPSEGVEEQLELEDTESVVPLLAALLAGLAAMGLGLQLVARGKGAVRGEQSLVEPLGSADFVAVQVDNEERTSPVAFESNAVVCIEERDS